MIQATQTGPATLSFNGKVLGVAHNMELPELLDWPIEPAGLPISISQRIYFSPDYAKNGPDDALADYQHQYRVTLAQERRRLARRRQNRS